jgi:hypothetical protein
MSAFGSASSSNGQFWYGSQTNFPGFLYKKNLGVGGRRSTKMNPGGNITCNSSTYLYNKYKPGTGGVGASSISNRRAKNRLATVCAKNNCFPCYNSLGQYSNYTHNPNGFYRCLTPPIYHIPPVPPPSVCSTYQQGSPWPTFRGLTNEQQGVSPNAGPGLSVISTLFGTFSCRGSSPVIDKNNNIYICGSENYDGLYSYSSNGILNWSYTNCINTSYSVPVIGCDGTVYFTDSIRMFAINPDGTLKWFTGNIGDGSDAAPIIVNNKIYCGTSDGLWEINENGNSAFKFPSYGSDNLSGNGYNLSSDGNLLFYISNISYLYAINLQSKAFIWATQNNPYYINYSFGIYNVPALDSNYVYAYAYDNNINYVLQINKLDGTIYQSVTLDDNATDSCPVLDKNGYLYIGSSNFYAIDTSDMTIKYSYYNAVTSSLFTHTSAVLDKNGIIYFLDTNNGTIYASNTPNISEPTAIYTDTSLISSYSSPAISTDGALYNGSDVGIIKLQ